MLKKIISIFLTVLLLGEQTLLFADANPNTEARTAWYFNETNTSTSGAPSNLKYFKYFDIIPDEITMKVFDNIDISDLKDKKLYVGYGVADPKQKECKIFLAADTGAPNDITVCLPWWRVEREYIPNNSPFQGSSTPDFIDSLRKNTKPPIVYHTCKKYASNKEYEGGKVTCTSYYDKLASESCWDNPKQSKCFVDNCGQNLKDNCTFLEAMQGMKTTLDGAVITDSKIDQSSTKVELVTYKYTCPAGALVEDSTCLDESTSVIYPYECKADDPGTTEDESEYTYCDEDKPVYDASGNVTGYKGTCKDGTTVFCKANSMTNKTTVCLEPVYQTQYNSKVIEANLKRSYTSHTVDVLSGEPDMYSVKDNCLRSNDVLDARDQTLYVRIVGDGYIDDDIYVLRHGSNGSHEKIYCNMQHAEDVGVKKSYDGDILQCIDNNGEYAFDKTVPIETTDIVTVQQNSENENTTGTPFAIGRNHYGSTKVTIDNVEVAPSTFKVDFPYYPGDATWRSGLGYLQTWDNTLSTFSILFPFAGAYELYFYNKYDQKVAKADIDMEDFKTISINGNMQLKLGKNMTLASSISDDVKDDNGVVTEKKANRDDDWVEWGGGVFGGHDSKTGEACLSPNDNYVKENAVTKVIIKDLLTGAIVPIPLVYPLPFPNRVFISKLKVYEKRKYRCYNDFETFDPTGDAPTRYVCSTNPTYQEYLNGNRTDIEGVHQWDTSDLCEQNCRDYQTCSATSQLVGGTSMDGYTCSPRGGEDIGGDLSGNLFSDKLACDSVCFTQNSCSTYSESPCSITNEKLSSPVTDYTGKTVYRNKSLAYKCDSQSDKQVGCNKYGTISKNVDISYNKDFPGFETKDHSDQFEDAMTHADMLNTSGHIFSGWNGKCSAGLKWDFSYLSNPMTIISYMMSAYSSVKWLGQNGVGWAQNMSKQFDSFTDSVSKPFEDAYKEVSNQTSAMYNNVENTLKDSISSGDTSKAIEASSQAASTAPVTLDNNGMQNLTNVKNTEYTSFGQAKYAMEGVPVPSEQTLLDQGKSMLKDYTGIDWDKAVFGEDQWYEITQGELVSWGVQSAMILAAPSEEDYLLADKLIKGYMGVGDDPEVLAYRSCMASIGASMPNLIAWSAKDDKSTPSELMRPWEHPLRMTPSQLASIATVSSEKYVTSHYVYKQTDNILMDVIAVSQDAYLKATQTICMGTKVAQAASHIENENNKKSMGLDAMSIAMMALGMVCPPCSFAAKIVMDLMTNVFTSIDTCNNETDALQAGLKDYKTHQAVGHEMCVPTNSYCEKKGFLGKCVRDAYEYCCYDKITTKIFAEGLKAQLNKGWESCNDITINDLKKISYRVCREGEIPYINKCFPASKYSEYQQALFRQSVRGIDMNGLTEQVTNSMAIDTK